MIERLDGLNPISPQISNGGVFDSPLPLLSKSIFSSRVTARKNELSQMYSIPV
jgi:hypothetical protein